MLYKVEFSNHPSERKYLDSTLVNTPPEEPFSEEIFNHLKPNGSNLPTELDPKDQHS